MKKTVVAAFFCILLLSVSCALAAVPGKPDVYAYAYDFEAGVLSSGDIEAISRYGAALEEATGIQVIAVVVDFLDGKDPADYATDLINTWGIGNQNDEGAVILLSRGDRRIQIGTGTGIDRVMTGSKCGELIDKRIDYFADNQFAVGMTALYGDVCEFLAKAKGKSLFSNTDSAIATVNAAETSAVLASEDETTPIKLVMDMVGYYIYFCVFLYVVLICTECSERRSSLVRILFLGWFFELFETKKKTTGARNSKAGMKSIRTGEELDMDNAESPVYNEGCVGVLLGWMIFMIVLFSLMGIFPTLEDCIMNDVLISVLLAICMGWACGRLRREFRGGSGRGFRANWHSGNSHSDNSYSGGGFGGGESSGGGGGRSF